MAPENKPPEGESTEPKRISIALVDDYIPRMRAAILAKCHNDYNGLLRELQELVKYSKHLSTDDLGIIMGRFFRAADDFYHNLNLSEGRRMGNELKKLGVEYNRRLQQRYRDAKGKDPYSKPEELVTVSCEQPVLVPGTVALVRAWSAMRIRRSLGGDAHTHLYTVTGLLTHMYPDETAAISGERSVAITTPRNTFPVSPAFLKQIMMGGNALRTLNQRFPDVQPNIGVCVVSAETRPEQTHVRLSNRELPKDVLSRNDLNASQEVAALFGDLQEIFDLPRA